MKKLVLFFLLIVQFSFSQEEESRQKPIFSFDHGFSVYLNKHINFGDNFLSEAHKSVIGFGIQKNIVNIYGFAVGVAYEFSHYRVTDKSIVGNIESANYSNFSGRVAYDYEISTKFTLKPYVGIGGTRLKHLKNFGNANNFGSISGTSYNAGINFAFNITNKTHLFTGVNYSYVSYEVNSAPEYDSFFNNSSQIQIHLGVGFF
jgi:hypothetical protein